jgi:hypothetical protein
MMVLKLVDQYVHQNNSFEEMIHRLKRVRESERNEDMLAALNWLIQRSEDVAKEYGQDS